MGTKPSDLSGVYGCAHCHDLLDRRDRRMDYIIQHHPMDLLTRIVAALEETHGRMIESGLITVKGDRSK